MSSPSSSLECAMLRLLGRDSGARFALLSHVSFATLPALARTCRSWRSWIDTDGAMPKHQWWVSLPRASSFAACPWTRRHLSGLSFGQWGDTANPFADRLGLHAVLSQVAAFPHLRSLTINILPDVEDDLVWQQCFTQLGSKLESFSIAFPLMTHSCDGTVAAVVKHLDKLVSLSSLSLTGRVDAPDQIDWSALPKLARLSHVSMTCGVLGFLWSDEQIRHVCNCKQLVSLSGGFARPELPNWEQRVIDFIDSRFPADAAPLPAMTSLALPAITPAVWSRLTRLSSLSALEPYKWIGFGAAEWIHLPQFTALRRVMLQPVSISAVLDAEPLSACTTIESLEFGRVRISESNLALLTRGLTRLHSIGFSITILQSLAPLSLSVTLTALAFHHCKSFDDVQRLFDVRTELPPLLTLRELSICPMESLTPEAAVDSTAAVLARMPALRPENFEQL